MKKNQPERLPLGTEGVEGDLHLKIEDPARLPRAAPARPRGLRSAWRAPAGTSQGQSAPR